MYIHIWILSLYLCAMFPLTLHLQASVVHGRRFDCEQYPHGSRPELNSTGLERRHLCLTNPKIVNGIREKEQHYNYFLNKYLYFDTNNVLFRNVTFQFSELVLLTVWRGLNKSSPFSRAVKMAISISCWPSEAVRKTVICYSTKQRTVWNACNSILLVYTTVQKFVDSKFFLLVEVSYVDQGCIYLSKKTVKAAILWSINTI